MGAAAVGAGLAIAAPEVFRIVRPGLKTALKAGLAGAAAARAAALHVGEQIEDLMAEVAHELSEDVAMADSVEASAGLATPSADKAPE